MAGTAKKLLTLSHPWLMLIFWMPDNDILGGRVPDKDIPESALCFEGLRCASRSNHSVGNPHGGVTPCDAGG